MDTPPYALRPATPADLPAVRALLADSALPDAGIDALFADRAADFVLAEADGALVGVAGLEVCCDDALLRSVAVRPAWRAHGVGRAMVKSLVCDAEARGVRALYLLTMTAEHYFPRFGFSRVERGAVPAAIADTLEFREACPATAVAMARPVAAA
ncbi:arsenic resistance N-acetyltransferase ArsN2 [Roseisolibacter sp. H3M3-2]|uniref:arsenic resistance N-acetyltransferase ArsN2 n=1 Tax=Roseisolibacter sp. H3M3-2 TaxID=3031323 RepID=UPI0023DAB8BF|nr:arsenic resistance N-acetyltransferase ArsN2 [Roseisolibacter sp. H3M3-2]MDF1504596.1 arsenic resistance N-acetyltransferase ArsN2 [Roseisolibacter sp. H3M3-2]